MLCSPSYNSLKTDNLLRHLGHYQVSSIKNLLNLLKSVHPDIDSPKSAVKNWLDDAAFASISASQRIFLARNCKEWYIN